MSKADSITTHYAFENGILGSMQRHADLGAIHIKYSAGAQVDEFTLVNNPSKGFWADELETFRISLELHPIQQDSPQV
jgi:hypothetical protein